MATDARRTPRSDAAPFERRGTQIMLFSNARPLRSLNGLHGQLFMLPDPLFATHKWAIELVSHVRWNCSKLYMFFFCFSLEFQLTLLTLDMLFLVQKVKDTIVNTSRVSAGRRGIFLGPRNCSIWRTLEMFLHSFILLRYPIKGYQHPTLWRLTD